MRQREGVRQVLAALRFQNPQQQGGQVRAEAPVGTGRPQQGVAAIEQAVADGGAQFAFVLRSDAHCVQDPAGPAVQAAERAAAALVTGRIDGQGIAVGQGGPQGRGALPMQRLQGRQEAIAQRGDGTGRKGEALAGQGLSDLLALEVALIAGQSDCCFPRRFAKSSRS